MRNQGSAVGNRGSFWKNIHVRGFPIFLFTIFFNWCSAKALVTGWNQVSFPLPDPAPVEEFLHQKVTGSINKIWAFRDGGWEYFTLEGGEGTLRELYPGESYWLLMASSGNLLIETSDFLPLDLSFDRPGWHLRSFSQDRDLSLALQVLTPFRVDRNHSLENILKVWSYDGGDWLSYDSSSGGSLSTLSAGMGSWFLIGNTPAPVQRSSPLVISPARSVNPVQWKRSTGPPGGGVWSISIAPSNPQVLYAPTHDLNILKSINGGDSWEQVGERDLGAHIFAPVAVDPIDEDRILISNGTIHISTDGGSSFLEGDVGSGENRGVVALTHAPTDPDSIYAAMEDGRVYRSFDRGSSFSLIHQFPSLEPQNLLRVHPHNKEMFYLVVQNLQKEDNHQILTSEDGGASFQTLRSDTKIYDLEINPVDPQKIYYTTEDFYYASFDGGISFQSTEVGGVLCLAPANPDILYLLSLGGEFFVSTNGGQSLSQVSSIGFEDGHVDHHEGLALEVDPRDSSRIYVGGISGFYRSSDGGVSFESINEGVVDDSVFTLAVHPSDRDHVLVGNFWSLGVFQTTDAGDSFELLEGWKHSEKADHYPMEIEFNPKNPNEIYITGEYGFKKSTDGGISWNSLGGELMFGAHFHGLSLNPENPQILYVGTGKGEDNALSGAHIYRSVDGGLSFEDLKNGFPTQSESNVYVLKVAPSNPSVVYAGVNAHVFVDAPLPTQGLGVYRSDDGGDSWEPRNSSLPSLSPFALAVDPSDENHVYVGLGHEHAHVAASDEEQAHGEEHGKGLYETKDGGASWVYVDSLPAQEISHIEFHPLDPRIVFVSFGENLSGGGGGFPRGFGLYLTMDGGRNWIQTAQEFSRREQVVMDVVFSSDGERVYVGTDDGFYRGLWSRE